MRAWILEHTLSELLIGRMRNESTDLKGIQLLR